MSTPHHLTHVTVVPTPSDLQLADHVAAARSAPQGIAGTLQGVLNWLLAFPLVVVLMLLTIGPTIGVPPSQTVDWSVRVIYAGMVLGVVAHVVNAQAARRQPSPSEGRELGFTLTDQALVITDTFSRLETRWQGVASVENDGRQIYILLDPQGVFVIPDRCFERRAHFDAFYAELAARAGQAKAAASASSALA